MDIASEGGGEGRAVTPPIFHFLSFQLAILGTLARFRWVLRGSITEPERLRGEGGIPLP